jgi:hypothetical protein
MEAKVACTTPSADIDTARGRETASGDRARSWSTSRQRCGKVLEKSRRPRPRHPETLLAIADEVIH